MEQKKYLNFCTAEKMFINYFRNVLLLSRKKKRGNKIW